MKTLDLHGKRHDKIETEVVNFIFMHEPPFEIITGNSKRMKSLVDQIITKHGFQSHPKNWINHGCLIVTITQGE